MKHEVCTQWMGKMQFTVNDRVIIWMPPRWGRSRHYSKAVSAYCPSGCTGMDGGAAEKGGKELRILM